MFQMKFSIDSAELKREIPHWEHLEDIPLRVIDFIKKTSDERLIYEASTKNYYCGKCTRLLDDSLYCEHCKIQHHFDEDYRHRDVTTIDKMTSDYSSLGMECTYLVFDVRDKDVYLYTIEENVYYDNPFSTLPHKTSRIDVLTDQSYFVEVEGLINIETDQFISFTGLAKAWDSFIDEFESCEEKMENDSLYREYNSILLDGAYYIYVDNLEELKNTVYRYSKIWKMSEYLKKSYYTPIANITLNPLFYPQFEYLVNYGLYDLALNAPNNFDKGKNFEANFGLTKDYLPFMAKNDISPSKLELLKLCPTKDDEVFIFLTRYFEMYKEYLEELVSVYKVNIKTLKSYFEKVKLPPRRIADYLDYIEMAKEIGLDLYDKKNLYPEDLYETHDKLLHEMEIIKDPLIDEKIGKVARECESKRYEDDEYVIFPASSIDDLIQESRNQENCVRTYASKVASGACVIYFLRKKSSPLESFVTVEVQNDRVVQARTKYNEEPSGEIVELLHIWEDAHLNKRPK